MSIRSILAGRQQCERRKQHSGRIVHSRRHTGRSRHRPHRGGIRRPRAPCTHRCNSCCSLECMCYYHRPCSPRRIHMWPGGASGTSQSWCSSRCRGTRRHRPRLSGCSCHTRSQSSRRSSHSCQVRCNFRCRSSLAHKSGGTRARQTRSRPGISRSPCR